MNAKAKVLGTNQTRYVDSSGLSPSNVASPADLGKIVSAAARYPLITEYTTTGAVNVTLPDSKRKLSFVNTNALVGHSDWKIGPVEDRLHQRGGQVPRDAGDDRQPASRDRAARFVGRLTRIADANRIRKWLERNPGMLPGGVALNPG